MNEGIGGDFGYSLSVIGQFKWSVSVYCINRDKLGALLKGPHRHNSFLFRVGLEPGSPAREAGALTRRLKASF